MNIAAKVAKRKQEHPELYCPTPRCLWRLQGKSTYCPRHGTRVMQDMRDGSKDYYISREDALKREREGKLFYELTNMTFMETEKCTESK